MSNPLDQNPWKGEPQYNNAGNPPYGNAYENTTTTNQPAAGFSSTGYYNAWTQESNKTEYTTNNNNAWDSTPSHYQQVPPQSPYAANNSVQPQQDAYRYTGTPYGNQSNQPNAYSQPNKQQQQNKQSAGPDPWNGEVYHTPNKWRFWLRFVLLLASIGHLGFAAGARPVRITQNYFYC